MNAFASLPEELRLAIAVAAFAALLAAGYRVARRFAEPHLAAADALLFTFATQYFSVGLTGMLGLLSPTAVVALSGALALGVFVLAHLHRERRDVGSTSTPTRARRWRLQRPAFPAMPNQQFETRTPRPATLFVFCVVAACLFQQWRTPPNVNDALVYHLSAAVHWLQIGRIDLFDTWYHNPANTYSPLGGSLLAAWWLGPLGCDVLARFMQAPAVPMIFFYAAAISRSAGARPAVAATLAAALACSRPVLGQCIVAKDDLLVAAFLLAAVAGVVSKDRLHFARAGLALGLLLGTKYTALLSLPIFLPLLSYRRPSKATTNLDPRLAGPHAGRSYIANQERPACGPAKRGFLLGVLFAIVLAGPWYLRNLVLTGNPLFPTPLPGLRGMFHATCNATVAAFFDRYFSIPMPLAVAVGVVFLGAGFFVLRSRVLLNRSAARLIFFGPLLSFAAYFALSPFDEFRFVLPAFALLMLAGAFLPNRAALPTAVALFAVAFGTSFKRDILLELAPVLAATVALAALPLFAWGLSDRLDPASRGRARLAGGAMLVIILAAFVFVQWQASLTSYRLDTPLIWQSRDLYGQDLVKAWMFVRDDRDVAPGETISADSTAHAAPVPPGSVIAYANTRYPYPLTGFDFDRHAVYCPTRKGVTHIADLPSFETRTSGDAISDGITAEMNADPDRDTWLANLRSAGVTHLFVAKNSAVPPENAFAESDPTHFIRVFDNPAATIYRFMLR